MQVFLGASFCLRPEDLVHGVAECTRLTLNSPLLNEAVMKVKSVIDDLDLNLDLCDRNATVLILDKVCVAHTFLFTSLR